MQWGGRGVGWDKHNMASLSQNNLRFAIFSTGRSHPHVQVCVCGEAAAGEHVNAVM